MLRTFSLDQREEWDSIVCSFSNYDVYYLSGYVTSLKLHGDGEPILLFYSDDFCRGINVVMKRDIALDKHFVGKITEGKYYDIATPYGYGGWFFEGDNGCSSKFKEEYLSWCEENGVVSEFVRFHPVLENAADSKNVSLYDIVYLGKTVAIQLDSEELIWERFSSQNRSHLRVAMKEGVRVEIETSKEALDVFKKIYKTTMDNDDAATYYYFEDEFFESLRNDLSGKFAVFTAYLGDIPIAASIMLYAGKKMNYHLSGQLYEYRRYSGTSLILYEAAKWGCHHGYEWLHLGGGLGAQEGPLYDFKKSFYKKGEDKLFHVGRAILNPRLYNELLEMREDIPDSNYFPKYRA